tara:strand:- start:9 stop:611 length:603 start_codon:yes stop_codon:yes gene_type:complete
MEILKIVDSEWNSLVLQTYSELKLLKHLRENSMPSIKQKRHNILSEELLAGMPLAKLICLLSDEGLSRLSFSKNKIKRCKKLRFWVDKINNLDLDDFSEDERFQLHLDLEEDLPSFILFLKDIYKNVWLKRWKEPSDPLFHPSPPLDGHSIQKVLEIPPGPCLGELMRHLSKEKAYGRFFTNQEAWEAARKWILENSPLL